MNLPENLPGHWTTAAGLEMAATYAGMTRDQLGDSDMPDLELANAIYLADRHDLSLIRFQTSAKERIRWLSVQLALRDMQLAEARRLLGECGSLIDEAVTTHIYDTQNGDVIPEDSAYVQAGKAVEAFLSHGAAQPAAAIRIGVLVDGGVVHEVFSDQPLPGVAVVLIDKDVGAYDEDEIYKVRGIHDHREWFEAGVVVQDVVHEERFDWSKSFKDPEAGEVVDVFQSNPIETENDHIRQRFHGELFSAQSLATLHDAFNPQAALHEGWLMAQSDTYGLQIERDNDLGRFATDDDAIAFVRARAADGSLYHLLALAIHEKQESENQADAKAAGYGVFRITTDDDTGAWGFIRPAGRDGGGPFWTETAAWSAAYRDALERGLLEDEG